MSGLRKHQRELMEVCSDLIESGEYVKHILAHVTPGGGKSALPVILANRLIPDLVTMRGPDALATHVCWVVPRDSLKQQAEQAFRSPFLQRALGSMRLIRSASNEVNPARDRNGYVTTYHAIAALPELHWQEFTRPDRRYLLVLDECHHINDEEHASWRRAIAPLIEAASVVLYMTGTPMRGDGQPIAFLPYMEVSGQRVLAADRAEGWKVVRYSRADALNERAIVPIRMRWADASLQYEKAGVGMIETTSFDVLDESAVGDAIQVAVRTDYARQMLDQAAREWLAYRADHPWSRFLVVAATQQLARDYATHLREQHGVQIEVALADEAAQKNRDVIANFRERGRPEALATVGMAYEGLDVPGITHIVALTHIRSASWVEQMLARGVRVVGDIPWDDQYCLAYVMDDGKMRDVVQVIEEEQVAALGIDRGATESPVGGGVPQEEERPAGERSQVIPLHGAMTGSRETDMRGEALSREETQQLEHALRVNGLAGKLTPIQLARLMRTVETARPVPAPVLAPTADSELEGALRDRIQKMATQYDRVRGVAFGTFHREEKTRTGYANHQKTITQLRETFQRLAQLLEKAGVA